MPFDPSIFGMANRPTVALENPMDIAQKQLAMQNQQMQFQQQQRAMQAAQDFQAQTGVSPEMAKHQQEIATAGWKNQEARASFEKSVREMSKEQRAQAHSDMSEFVRIASPLTAEPDPAKFQAGVQAAVQQFDADGSKGWAKLAQNLTPDALKQMTAATMDHKTWIEKTFPKDVKASSTTHQNDQRELFTLGPDNAPQYVVDPTTGKRVKAPAPSAALMMGGGGLSPEALQMLVDKFKATGELGSDLGRNMVLRKQVIEAAAKQGGVDLATAKQDFASTKKGKADFEPNGTSGKTISAINTMTEHLATARRMAEALNNGNLPLANKIGQAVGVQMGQDTATNFATIKQFLAGEVAKVATGGHLTEGEIHAAADRLNQAQSPAQLMGALDTMREVAGGKLIAINQDYKRLFGKGLDETGRLTPATKSAFQTVNGAHSGAPAPSALPKIASPSDPAFASLPKGAHFVGPDGKERVKN